MWGGINMVTFYDKTDTTSGTPINRANLMAMQGWENTTTIFNPDGTVQITHHDQLSSSVLISFGVDSNGKQYIREDFNDERIDDNGVIVSSHITKITTLGSSVITETITSNSKEV